MKKFFAALAAACAFIVVAGCHQAGVSEITLSGTGVKAQTFGTVQEALDAVGEKEGSFTIKLPAGTYEEVLYYNGPADITLSGCTDAKYGEDVRIAIANTGDLLLCKRATGQKARCVFEFEGTGNLTVENITFHNTFVRGSVKGSNTQAETIGFDSTGTLAAYNCAFLSTQDTLRMTGKSWFYKCYVEGDTDFIWMESSGKVALFEECEIVSIYDPNHTDPTTYITAPRMDKGNAAGKGLVIFNSSISSQDGETTFLARTPWNSGYYNQVAFVSDTVASGKIESSLWKGTPLMASGIPQTVIGWKIDRATANAIGADVNGRKDILTDEDVEKEFSGRETILNRYYDLATLKYKKDLDSYWDVKKLASTRGWKVSGDSSKSLLPGEEKATRTVYTFAENVSKDLNIEGFAVEGGKLVGEAGSKITFPVKGKSLVLVTGCSSGNGTIKSENQGPAFYDFNTGSSAKFAEKAYVVYEGASTVTIEAAGKTSISKIVVESDKAVEFIPVSSIAVSSADNEEVVYGRKSLQFSAKITPPRPTNSDYEWTVSDPGAATIDANGMLTAADVSEDKDVVVKATAKDANGVSGEFKLKIAKPDTNAVGITWLNSLEASKSLAGVSDNETLARAGNAVPSPGTWTYNASKINAEFARGGITYTGYSGAIAGKDVLYVDFPITAQDNLEITSIDAAFGNHGTSNVAVLFQGIVGSRKTELASDTSRAARSVKKTYDLENPYAIRKGETANIRVVLYGLDGGGETTIAAGKAPTVATITISGKRK